MKSEIEQTSKSFTDQFNAGIEKAKAMFTDAGDIVSVIKEDHKPLKELIKIMKSPDTSSTDALKAFSEFAPLLVTHARAEEESLYKFMQTKSTLRMDSFEGVTEHELADQLVESTKRVTDKDEIHAKIKVLAELVEHHIEEEESDILPLVKDEVSEADRKMLTQKYSAFQSQIIADGQDDAPSEKDLEATTH